MGLKDRMLKMSPEAKARAKRPDTSIRQFIATGAVAGDIAVPGLRVGDKIISVLYRLTAAGNLVDMTPDFGGGSVGDKKGNGGLISRPNIINNTGGTTTASGQIIVLAETFDIR